MPDRRFESTPARPDDRHEGRGRPAAVSGRRPAGRTAASIVLTGLLWLGLGLLSLILFAGTFLVVAPPSDLINERITAEIRARTGRELHIAGGSSFTLLPSLRLTMANVSLSAPPAMQAPPLIEAEGLEVSLALLPLLLREVQIDRLVFIRPVIDLRIDASGRRSWDFVERSVPAGGQPIRLAQLATRRDDGRHLPAELQDFARNSSLPPPRRVDELGRALSLDDVRIVEGVLRFADLPQGRTIELRDIEARISLGHGLGALALSGQALVEGERFHIDSRVASLRDAMDDRPFGLTLKLASAVGDASFEGMLTTPRRPQLDGRVSLKAASGSLLARRLAIPQLAPLGAIDAGPLAVEGLLKTTPTSVAVREGTYRWSDVTAQGSASIDTSGARPFVKANLKIAALDLDALAGRQTKARGADGGGSAGSLARAAPAPASPPGKLRSIEELLGPGQQAPATQVRGFARRSGEDWSMETINLVRLDRFDLEGRFDIGQLQWQGVKASEAQVEAGLKAGALKLTLMDAVLHGGRAKGLVTIEAKEHGLTLGVNLSTEGVAVRPLLAECAGLDLADGRGRLSIAVSASGLSERDLIGSLLGKAEISLVDGAIIGWDANAMMAGLRHGRIPSLERSAASRTPVHLLQGTFQIANGVARTQDLKLEGSALKTQAVGLVNIVDRNIDFVLRPQPGQHPAPQGGLAAIEIPVRIAGPWGSPSLVPDVNAALKSPQTQEAVRQLGRQVREGNVDGALKAVIGDGPGSEQKINKAKDVMKQLLGR